MYAYAAATLARQLSIAEQIASTHHTHTETPSYKEKIMSAIFSFRFTKNINEIRKKPETQLYGI